LPRPSDPLVIGLDIGGSSTRAVVASVAGERWGAGAAGGGNPTSHGVERAADQLRAALRAALADVDPGLVRAGAIGLAGAGRLRADPAGRAAFDRAWSDAGLRCRYDVHGDALVGYASATAAPSGTVLIAGTGAIAAQVRELTLDRVADGHGWLLGDDGSGFWLGREAVRHTLADLDAHRTPSPLSALVLTELLGSARVAARPRETVDLLVQTVTRRPAIDLAALAPLVVRAERAGDPAAGTIIATAASRLAGSVARIRTDDATTPVVLGGGLLTGPGPVAPGDGLPVDSGTGPLTTAVSALLAQRWPTAALLTAGDGAAAAAWLAARTLPEVGDPTELHRRLLTR
jgi:glucosamine kinase